MQGEAVVWAVHRGPGPDPLRLIDPGTGHFIGSLRGRGPAGIAAARGGVWVTNALDDTVTRRAAGDRARSLQPVVANEPEGSVTRIDPATGRVIETIAVGVRPAAVVSAHGAIWVAGRREDTLARIAARARER